MYIKLPFLKKLGKWKTTSFAKPLKECLSIITGVPVERFEDRDFKENWFICLRTFHLTSIEDATIDNILSINILSDKDFVKAIKNFDTNKIQNSYISIRQLMQYFGTEVIRHFLSDKTWINATLTGNNIIITDLRFKKEFEELDYHKSYRILIERPGCNPGNHASEREIMELKAERTFDAIIQNDGTLKDLFYKVKELL